MIEIKNLCFSYADAPFTEHLSLTIHDGALTALIGENGSGKSTLFKLITGGERQKSGDILLDGMNMRGMKRREIAHILSYFPQSRPTPDMRVCELVLMGRYPFSSAIASATEKDQALAHAAMEKMAVLPFAERNLHTLSFGERQRVYLAMLLAQDTQTCLFDEPTNFLDISAKFSMLDALTDLKNEGKCVFCILHDLSLAMRYADRLIVMKDGNLFADGTPDALYKSGAIEKAFGVHLARLEQNGEIVYAVLPTK